MPTKSGIIGLLAAAKGLRREDPIEGLVDLRLAVRTDQAGSLLRDFHTAHHPVTGKSMPLSQRYYWADAVYTAYVEGRDEIIDGLSQALADPAYPLYLGRRSCVPEGRLVLGVSAEGMDDLVRNTPWQATARERRQYRNQPAVTLDVQADEGVFEGLTAARQLQDVPVSFDPERREYAVRAVVDTCVEVANPDFQPSRVDGHDPFTLAGDFT